LPSRVNDAMADIAPSVQNCSIAWRNGAGDIALLLGDKRNACAAMTGSHLLGYEVCHVICVGNSKTASKLQDCRNRFLCEGAEAFGKCLERAESMHRASEASRSQSKRPSTLSRASTGSSLRTASTSSRLSSCCSETTSSTTEEVGLDDTELPPSEDAQQQSLDYDHLVAFEATQSEAAAREARCRSATFRSYFLADTLAADVEVDVEAEMGDILAEIMRALADASASSTASDDEVAVRPRAVLLHCDQGINRSPTIALAFLLRQGMSLREAYRMLEAARPQIDPLPSFRRALLSYELHLHGSSTVTPCEPFAMHISELVKQVDMMASRQPGDAVGPFFNPKAFNEALRLRRESVEALLREEVVSVH